MINCFHFHYNDDDENYYDEDDDDVFDDKNLPAQYKHLFYNHFNMITIIIKMTAICLLNIGEDYDYHDDDNNYYYDDDF